MDLSPIHPKCLEYPWLADEDPAGWSDLLRSIKENGFDPAYPILRIAGQVVDGKNRQRACELTGATPTYRDLPPDADVDTAIAKANQARGHYGPRRDAIRKARIARAVQLRQDGASIRTIAEGTGVSYEQARRDLADAAQVTPLESPGATPAPDGQVTPPESPETVEPKDGKVTGKDGKRYDPHSANGKPRKPRRPTPGKAKLKAPPPDEGLPAVDFSIGTALENMAYLLDVRTEYAGRAESGCRNLAEKLQLMQSAWEVCRRCPPEPDANGTAAPERVRPVFDTLSSYRRADAHLKALRELVNQLARAPGGDLLRLRVKKVGDSDVDYKLRLEGLEDAGRVLKHNRPHAVCPTCKGANKALCHGCAGKGWVTASAYRDLTGGNV